MKISFSTLVKIEKVLTAILNLFAKVQPTVTDLDWIQDGITPTQKAKKTRRTK